MLLEVWAWMSLVAVCLLSFCCVRSQDAYSAYTVSWSRYHIPFCRRMVETPGQSHRGVTEEEGAEPGWCCLSCCPHPSHPVILACCVTCLFVNPLSSSVQGKLLISISLSMFFVLVSWHIWHNICQSTYVGKSNKWVKAAGPGFAVAPTSVWSSS